MLDKIVKWFGRLLGVSLIIVIAMHYFGEESLDLNEISIWIISAKVVMIVGVILGFWRDLVGSLLIVAGYIIFAAVSGKIITGPIYPQFLIVALLYYYNSRNK